MAEEKRHTPVYNEPMDYEDRLRALREAVLAELKGPGGLLAVTEKDLVFIDHSGVQRLSLASIKRITRGEGGVVAVLGEGGRLEIPLKAFPMDELRLFLEGLKSHVARARRKPSPPPPEPPTAPEPPRPQEAPAPKPAWEEEAPPAQGFAPAKPAREGKDPLAFLGRPLALLSLAYGLGFVLLNPTDLWVQLGVVLASLNFFVLLWSFGSLRSS